MSCEGTLSLQNITLQGLQYHTYKSDKSIERNNFGSYRIPSKYTTGLTNKAVPFEIDHQCSSTSYRFERPYSRRRNNLVPYNRRLSCSKIISGNLNTTITTIKIQEFQVNLTKLEELYKQIRVFEELLGTKRIITEFQILILIKNSFKCTCLKHLLNIYIVTGSTASNDKTFQKNLNTPSTATGNKREQEYYSLPRIDNFESTPYKLYSRKESFKQSCPIRFKRTFPPRLTSNVASYSLHQTNQVLLLYVILILGLIGAVPLRHNTCCYCPGVSALSCLSVAVLSTAVCLILVTIATARSSSVTNNHETLETSSFYPYIQHGNVVTKTIQEFKDPFQSQPLKKYQEFHAPVNLIYPKYPRDLKLTQRDEQSKLSLELETLAIPGNHLTTANPFGNIEQHKYSRDEKLHTSKTHFKKVLIYTLAKVIDTKPFLKIQQTKYQYFPNEVVNVVPQKEQKTTDQNLQSKLPKKKKRSRYKAYQRITDDSKQLTTFLENTRNIKPRSEPVPQEQLLLNTVKHLNRARREYKVTKYGTRLQDGTRDNTLITDNLITFPDYARLTVGQDKDDHVAVVQHVAKSTKDKPVETPFEDKTEIKNDSATIHEFIPQEVPVLHDNSSSLTQGAVNVSTNVNSAVLASEVVRADPTDENLTSGTALQEEVQQVLSITTPQSGQNDDINNDSNISRERNIVLILSITTLIVLITVGTVGLLTCLLRHHHSNHRRHHDNHHHANHHFNHQTEPPQNHLATTSDTQYELRNHSNLQHKCYHQVVTKTTAVPAGVVVHEQPKLTSDESVTCAKLTHVGNSGARADGGGAAANQRRAVNTIATNAGAADAPAHVSQLLGDKKAMVCENTFMCRITLR